MSKKYHSFIYLLCTFCFWGCVKPFAPDVTTKNYNYLVVEGMINLTDSTIIKLSRTVTITSKTTPKAELRATVTIEGGNGTSYALKELGNGLYVATPLNLSPTIAYRLKIKTAGGSTYVSDYTASMVSPPIDSISWQASDNLKLYVNTHDPKNATHYYRWDYNEEWEFYSDYNSGYISNGIDIVRRTAAQQAFHCWGGDTSHLITLGTSTKLSSDVINQQLVNTINASAEKIGVKYSIMVKQYGLTKDAYDYWTLLKKNTESLGSVFDAQPSGSIGNIHNVNNAAETVIGYISVGTVSTKRIFIAKNQLPVNWITQAEYPDTSNIGNCALLGALYELPTGQILDPFQYPQFEFIDWLRPEYLGDFLRLVPVSARNPGDPHPDYSAARPICVECTLRGSNNKPAYWQ